jgi:hypothetical protein
VKDEQFLDPVGREYDLTPSGVVAQAPHSKQMSERCRLYGGVSARYWAGTPGASDLVSGTAYLWEPIRVADQAEVESELRQAFRQRVAQGIEQQTGLLVGARDLDRIEYLTIWTAESDLVERCKAFEQGWSALLPSGKRARDLTSADIKQLVRRIHGDRARKNAAAADDVPGGSDATGRQDPV